MFIDFKIPTRLNEACGMLRELGPAGQPIAGGTAALFVAAGADQTAVDITRLGLAGVRLEGDGFEIGAVTPVAALQAHHAAGWVLDRVALRFVTQPIRNMATLGGNIVRVFPWADFPVALLALGAELVIANGASRTIAADEFFAKQPFRLFQPGDLLTQVRIRPLAAGQGFGYHKETRTHSGFSQATVAAWLELEGGKIKRARVAAGAALPFPARLPAAEAALVGQNPAAGVFPAAAAAATAGLKARAADGVSEEYTGHLVRVAIRDALAAATAEAERS